MKLSGLSLGGVCMTDGTKILIGCIIFSIAIIIAAYILSQGIVNGLGNCGNNISFGIVTGSVQVADGLKEFLAILAQNK